MQDSRLEIRLPLELAEDLSRCARELGIARSEYIRLLLAAGCKPSAARKALSRIRALTRAVLALEDAVGE